jgi:hypothetical protein
VSVREVDAPDSLVLVDDDDLEAMQQDLADPAVMEYCWQHTAQRRDVLDECQRFPVHFPGRDLPRDLALYDRQLLVAYDESRLILRVDVVRRDAGVRAAFSMT